MAINTKPICPVTGQVLERGVKSMTLTYKGHSLVVDMPGWYGKGSAEAIHTHEDMKVSDRALNLLKARAENLLEPSSIQRVRKKLKLTQVKAGEILGGGPRAFQRYENGDALPSRAICSVLKLLDKNPSGLATLIAEDSAASW